MHVCDEACVVCAHVSITSACNIKKVRERDNGGRAETETETETGIETEIETERDRERQRSTERDKERTRVTVYACARELYC